MSIRATFSYFQGMEGDMYQFYRIPKLLFTSEYFKNLSCEANRRTGADAGAGRGRAGNRGSADAGG